jgi:hypothetical protein
MPDLKEGRIYSWRQTALAAVTDINAACAPQEYPSNATVEHLRDGIRNLERAIEQIEHNVAWGDA